MANQGDLPAELWTLVFEHATHFPRRMGDLVTVRAVCRHWRNAAAPLVEKVPLSAVPIRDCLNSVSRTEWLLSHHPQKWWEKKFGERLLAEAAKVGNLAVVQLLKERGHRWNEWTCAKAARNGHLKILQWARDCSIHEQPCPWNEWTCADAALGGHLEVLKWLRSHGDLSCPWDEWTCTYAAGNGHLEVLKWLRDETLHVSTCPWNQVRCLHWAQENNRTAIVDWITAQGSD